MVCSTWTLTCWLQGIGPGAGKNVLGARATVTPPSARISTGRHRGGTECRHGQDRDKPALSRGRTRPAPALTPLSEAARTARQLLPPDVLYDAKSDPLQSGAQVAPNPVIR